MDTDSVYSCNSETDIYCSVCLDQIDLEKDIDEIISPCNCGPMSIVHTACYEKLNINRCNICNFKTVNPGKILTILDNDETYDQKIIELSKLFGLQVIPTNPIFQLIPDRDIRRIVSNTYNYSFSLQYLRNIAFSYLVILNLIRAGYVKEMSMYFLFLIVQLFAFISSPFFVLFGMTYKI